MIKQKVFNQVQRRSAGFTQTLLKGAGFTLIELLVVIVIIGLLSTMAVVALNNVRMKSRDVVRVADIKNIQTALEFYFNDVGFYPAVVASGGAIANAGITYMALVPTAPIPADNTCNGVQNTYTYTRLTASTYTLDFCLGEETGGIGPGVVQASERGIQ